MMSYLDSAIENNNIQIFDNINNPVSTKNELQRGWGMGDESTGYSFYFRVSKPTRSQVKKNIEYWVDLELQS